MNQAICTISTNSHLYKAYALAESIKPFGYTLKVLVVDKMDFIEVNTPCDLQLFNLSYLKCNQSKKIIEKFRHNLDKLRWGLKSIFLKQLLIEYEQVIYCDNDIYFFNSPKVFFEKLYAKSVLLTPHYYKTNPREEQNWLEANFKVGLYNAGFIGVNKAGIEALEWWSECCMYNIKKSFSRGLFDDQKYLDLLPILFDKVEVLKSRGFNLAGWNHHTLNPEIEKITFVHFAELSLREFQKPNNKYYPTYLKYIEVLKKYKPDYLFVPSYYSIYSIKAFSLFLKWKLIRAFEKLKLK